MAGEVKRLIDELIELRTKGRPELDPFVRVHLVLSGIDQPSGLLFGIIAAAFFSSVWTLWFFRPDGPKMATV